MTISSAYVFGKNITPGTVPPPPYPFYWWNSPGVCPVREVNGYKPSIDYDTSYPSYDDQNRMCTIDTSNKNYDGGDIGCNAIEITDDMPSEYNCDDEGGPYVMRNIIPLYDSNEQESARYRIMVEFGIYYLEPYVDANNQGYYWVSSQMRLTDRVEQDNVLSTFTDAEGVFKSANNHFYMFAGADTFYYRNRWTGQGEVVGSIGDRIYSGNIIEACSLAGAPRVKWAGVAFSLQWIENHCGVHLDRQWYNPT